MIATFFASIVGDKLAKPVMWIVGALALAALLGIGYCSIPRDHTAERQAEQTTRSGDALGNTASIAIETIGNRTATDATVDQAVSNVQGNIDNAQDPDQLRNAVIDGVCRKASHRNDPACAVR